MDSLGGQKIIGIITRGFAGFLAGLILAILLGHWVWLEMRLNVGLAIPLCTILFILAGLGGGGFVFLLDAVLVVVFLSLYGFRAGAAAIVPATLVREGFLASHPSLGWVNVILGILFSVGNLAVAVEWRSPGSTR